MGQYTFVCGASNKLLEGHNNRFLCTEVWQIDGCTLAREGMLEFWGNTVATGVMEYADNDAAFWQTNGPKESCPFQAANIDCVDLAYTTVRGRRRREDNNQGSRLIPSLSQSYQGGDFSSCVN